MKTLSELMGALGALLRSSGGSPSGRISAGRVQGLGVSRIRASSTKVVHADPVDLASGAPAFSTPIAMKQHAVEAILNDHNQYSHPNGDRELRLLLSRSTGWDADHEITITSGTSAALAGVLLATINPGDEVIVFEPFFEAYATAIRLAGGTPRYVKLSTTDWSVDPLALAAAFNKRTRAVILNSPHNPTGRVFTLRELELVAELCEANGCVLISDEIYSQIVFEGTPVSLSGVKANRERNVIVDGLSKAYNATGWRVGYVIAPPAITDAFRIVHSVMGLSAPTPLQHAARSAFDQATLAELRETIGACRQSRNLLCAGLMRAGFHFRLPKGATYVFADASHLGASSDEAARDLLIEKTGVTSVAGSVFFEQPTRNSNQWLRFCFARDRATIEKAVDRLELLKR